MLLHPTPPNINYNDDCTPLALRRHLLDAVDQAPPQDLELHKLRPLQSVIDAINREYATPPAARTPMTAALIEWMRNGGLVSRVRDATAKVSNLAAAQSRISRKRGRSSSRPPAGLAIVFSSFTATFLQALLRRPILPIRPSAWWSSAWAAAPSAWAPATPARRLILS